LSRCVVCLSEEKLERDSGLAFAAIKANALTKEADKAKQVWNVPSMFPQCSLNVPSMFPQCSLNVPSMFPQWLLRQSRPTRSRRSLTKPSRCGTFHQCSLNVPSLFPQCSLCVPSMFPQCSLNVPTMFPQCFLNVPSMFPERNVPSMFPEYHPCSAWVLFDESLESLKP
jgi:hypothetical protein